jgi:hypothetical protein
MLYVQYVYLTTGQAYSIRDNPIFFSERMLHKNYDRKGSVGEKKICGREPQGAWRQDELIGGKPLVVK